MNGSDWVVRRVAGDPKVSGLGESWISRIVVRVGITISQSIDWSLSFSKF